MSLWLSLCEGLRLASALASCSIFTSLSQALSMGLRTPNPSFPTLYKMRQVVERGKASPTHHQNGGTQFSKSNGGGINWLHRSIFRCGGTNYLPTLCFLLEIALRREGGGGKGYPLVLLSSRNCTKFSALKRGIASKVPALA